MRSETELFGKTLSKEDDYIEISKRLVTRGCKMAIISYYTESDFVATEHGIWKITSNSKIEHAHLLGTGSAYMAGMVMYYLKNGPKYVEISKYGFAAALAKTWHLKKEFPSVEEIDNASDKFTVERVE